MPFTDPVTYLAGMAIIEAACTAAALPATQADPVRALRQDEPERDIVRP